MVVDYHSPLINMDQEVMENSGFLIMGHRMEFYGICPDCSKDEKLN
jgi:Fur family peroxide stress response transcriptional regulator